MEFFTPGHLVVLAIVALVLFFGWKQLPDMTRSLGRSLRIFKTEIKGMSEDDKVRKNVQAQPAALEGAQPADPATQQQAAPPTQSVPPPPVVPVADAARPATRPRPRPSPVASPPAGQSSVNGTSPASPSSGQ